MHRTPLRGAVDGRRWLRNAMKYDPQKHHRRSIRLPGYDYSKCGAYFVTICTRNGETILAKDVKSVGVALAATPDPERDVGKRNEFELDPRPRFELTSIGEIVDRDWRDLPVRFPMVSLDEYVIMPNHFHGIVIINALNESKTNDAGQGVAARATPTLGTIIGTFKSKSINNAIAHIEETRLDMIGKIWQRNYYEKVIRNERDLNDIREYIRNNPYKWEVDEENPANIAANKQLHGTSP